VLRPSKPLTNDASRRLAFLLLGLVFAELFFLSALVPFDETVLRWVQTYRSCELDRLSFFLKDPLIGTLIILGSLSLVWLCLYQRWAEAWHAMLVVVFGEIVCTLLKHSFARARPSALSPTFDGNSFPSSHIIAALLIVGVLGFFLSQQRWPKWLKFCLGSLGVTCVFAVSWQRVYSGQHWFSDVIGSMLLASAWLCFALPRPALLQLSWRSALLWTGLLISPHLVAFIPHLQLVLPSVVATYEEPLFNLSFGEDIPPLRLHGDWGEHSREPAGPITWAKGEEVGVEIELPSQGPYIMKLAVRPVVLSPAFSCFPVDVSVNQQPAARLLLHRGWREYTLQLDPAWIVPGANRISFRIGADFPTATADQRTVAFLYLRFFPESS
jgi:membrane-associated phospholipid phosphatase